MDEAATPQPETPRRVIAHVDADAFYASIHLLEDPSLEGKPVVVAGSSARGVVTTANYEARRYGIGSAQPAARARQLCPHAVFVPPDFPTYKRYSRQAMAVMREFSEAIEPLSLDEAYLDITHHERPVRAMRELVARIREETGLTYSVGIGPNKLCAKVLSDLNKPAAFNVASREQCCELFAEQSPRLIPGFGPKTVDALEAVGLRTIAQVREADAELLAARFGPNRGLELQSRARFEHGGAVSGDREPVSMSDETTFEYDIGDLEELEGRTRELAAELCRRLQARDLAGRTVGLKVRLADFTTVTRARTIDERTNDPATVSAIACELLRAYDPPQPVRLLGVRVAGFDAPIEPSSGPRAWAARQLRLPVGPGSWSAG